jgi:hypothetical protein
MTLPATAPRRHCPATGQIQIRIERVALHGFSTADARSVAMAMEVELARLASQPRHVFSSAQVPTHGPVQYEPSRDPERAGRAVAQALWAGIAGVGEDIP